MGIKKPLKALTFAVGVEMLVMLMNISGAMITQVLWALEVKIFS